jgi:pimeloyl-ACP methyl ester carboxylesterase
MQILLEFLDQELPAGPTPRPHAPLTAADVQYGTTRDGVRIAYAVEGEGFPILECQGTIGSFFDAALRDSDSPVRLRSYLSGRIVRYDMRGTGLSQRDVQDFSHDALLLDMEAVVDALGLQEFAVAASTMSGLRAIGFAVKHPGRVRALILEGTTARLANVFPAQVMEGLCGLARTDWTQAAQTIAGLNDTAGDPEGLHAFGEMLFRSADGETVARLLEQSYPTDVRPLLPLVKARTLVVHVTGDEIIPFIEGQKLASAIPGAELAALDHPTRGFNARYEGEVADVIARFLAGGDS